MEILTYHTLGLGFIAMSLKTSNGKKDSNKTVIMDTGLLTVNSYLIQGIVGLALTLLISLTTFSILSILMLSLVLYPLLL